MSQSFTIKTLISKEENGARKYIGEADGKEYFVKECKNDTKLEREFTNQKFLYELSQEYDTGFNFLEPKKTESKVYYPVLSDEYEWMATGALKEDEFHQPDEYLDEMIKFFQFCHDKIGFEDVPKSMKKRYEQKGDQHYLDKFDTDSKYLIENNLLTELEANELREILQKHVDKRAFQHHDVVPWHMAKNKETGEISLVDPQWADWSLWAYDIAYFILQMIGYAGRINPHYSQPTKKDQRKAGLLVLIKV